MCSAEFHWWNLLMKPGHSWILGNRWCNARNLTTLHYFLPTNVETWMKNLLPSNSWTSIIHDFFWRRAEIFMCSLPNSTNRLNIQYARLRIYLYIDLNTYIDIFIHLHTLHVFRYTYLILYLIQLLYSNARRCNSCFGSMHA